MNFSAACLATLLLGGFWTAGRVANEPVLPLRVLYVGNSKDVRFQEFAEFLKRRFTHADVADRAGFEPLKARGADVVLLDWSQSDNDLSKAHSPFGELKAWSKPTVLLGSSGLLIAGAWQVIGGAG